MKIAIATTLFLRPGLTPSAGSSTRLCSLAAWCAGAAQLSTETYMLDRAEVLIVTNAKGEAFARRECTGSSHPLPRFYSFSQETLEAIRAYQRSRLLSHASESNKSSMTLAAAKAFTKRVSAAFGYMLKWEVVRLTQYESVFFVDIDAMLLLNTLRGAQDRIAAEHAWTVRYDQFMHDPSVQLLAQPSQRTLLNTGVMLLKPSRRVYEDGLRAMRGGFDDTGGFEGVGPPLNVIPVSIKENVSTHYGKEFDAFPRENRWLSLDGGDIDQGFFLHMFGVRERAYAVSSYRRFTIFHFCGTTKPWLSTAPKCAPLFELLGVLHQLPGQKHGENAPKQCRLTHKGKIWPLSCASSTYELLSYASSDRAALTGAKMPSATAVRMSRSCFSIFRERAQLLLTNLAAAAGNETLQRRTLGCERALLQSVF